MHARSITTAICVVVGLSLPLGALQSTFTEKEYAAAMKEISLTAGDAEGHLQARYWTELEADADMLLSLFEKIESFWKARDTQKAADLAKKAQNTARALKSAAVKDDHEAAGAAIRSLKDTCESCHRQFREKTEDGYRIKGGS